MKILNLYAGIGGNRKLWGNEHEITSVELDKDVAETYQHFFPNDTVIIRDAHEYLLENFKKFDFIWSSQPCPTHSRMRILMAEQGKKFKFPDMKLWEEIIFLQHFFKGKYCVENVITYYKPFIIPKKLGNHYYWNNFNIGNIKEGARNLIRMKQDDKIKEKTEKFNYDFTGLPLRKAQILKMLDNCVEPKTGQYILDCAMNVIRKENTEQIKLF